MEVGISFISDRIGDGIVSESTIAADYAYILNFNETTKLSLVGG